MIYMKLKISYYLYGLISMACVIFYIRIIYIEFQDAIFDAILILICSLVLGIQQYRKLKNQIRKLWSNKEIFYCIVWGNITAIYINSVFNVYINELIYSRYNFLKWIMPICVYGMCFYLVFFFRKTNREKKNRNMSTLMFFSDDPISDEEDNKFFDKEVENGITLIKGVNQGVIGIEGRWGIGKTSFVNLCCQKLAQENNKMVIYYFNPLYLKTSDELLRFFYNGLIQKIGEKHFIPELECLMEWYIKSIIDNGMSYEINIGILKFKNSPKRKNIEELYKNLKIVLQTANIEILVIIDDLDRTNFEIIQKIFFMMKNIFKFPGLKFIICYDMKNIIWSAKLHYLYGDNLEMEYKIVEFMEKYIDVNKKILITSKQLHMLLQSLDDTVNNNRGANPVLLHDFLGEIKLILSSKTFAYYEIFLGTPRQIKRIVNIILNICYHDLKHYDFYSKDFINLLMIYVYYPTVFKDIFYAETDGKNGFFSWRPDLRSEKEKYPSKEYEKYIKTISDTYCNFLLTELFYDKGKYVEEQVWLHSLACFNMVSSISSVGNLEKYLKLIVNSEVPNEKEQYHFYIDIIDNNILQSGKKVQEELQHSFDDLELKGQLALLNVLCNTKSNDFKSESNLMNIIYFIIAQLPNYSIVEENTSSINGVKLKLIIYIVLLLNKLPEVEHNGILPFNEKEKIKIYNAIFSIDNGILEKIISVEKNGILGLFNILYFRGGIDIRHNNFFNISDSLVFYEDETINLNGMDINEISKIELRRISQKIYEIFKKIFGNKNLFDELKGLEDSLFCMSDNLSNDISRGIQFEMAIFIIYQLGSSLELGRYDLTGENDNSGINIDFGKYLVEKCFKNNHPEEKHCVYFIEFLILCFYMNKSMDIDLFKHIHGIENFATILSGDAIKNYIIKHYTQIRQISYDNKYIFFNNQKIPFNQFTEILFPLFEAIFEKKDI